MTEQDNGVGRLVSLEADQSEYFVDYSLTVDTQIMGSSEKFDPARTVKQYALTVKPQGSDNIRDGEFTLKTNGETLRVRKVGSRWVVVVP